MVRRSAQIAIIGSALPELPYRHAAQRTGHLPLTGIRKQVGTLAVVQVSKQALSEFVYPACLDSIAHFPGGQDHSAYIPDHGSLLRDRPHLAGDGPRPVRAGSSLALGFLAGVSVVTPVSSVACTLAGTLTCARCPMVTVTLETGGADTSTQRAIPRISPLAATKTAPSLSQRVSGFPVAHRRSVAECC